MPKDEKEKLVPNLRFKGFTDDWIQEKLETQVTDLKSYPLPRKFETKEESSYRYVHYGDIHTGIANIINNVEDLPKIVNGKYETLDKGDLILADASEDYQGIAWPAILNVDPQENVLAGLHTIALRPNQNIDSMFLYYTFLNTDFRKFGYRMGTGMKVFGISKKNLYKYNLSKPINIEEQERISSLLIKLNNIITLEQEKREWLEEIKEYLITKLFSNSSRIPDLRFNNFIDRWDKYQLFELGDYYNGLSGKTKKDFGHGEAEYIVYKNVYSNPIADVSGIDKVEIDLKQNEVRYGDILFTTSSETPDEVGLTSVWMETKKNVYLNSFCFGFRPNRYINPYFIAYYLRSDYFRNQMIPLAQGISRYNISKIKVMDLEIILPDREEQDKIGNAFKLLDESLIANREKLKRLKKVKAMLLQNLFI